MAHPAILKSAAASPKRLSMPCHELSASKPTRPPQKPPPQQTNAARNEPVHRGRTRTASSQLRAASVQRRVHRTGPRAAAWRSPRSAAAPWSAERAPGSAWHEGILKEGSAEKRRGVRRRHVGGGWGLLGRGIGLEFPVAGNHVKMDQ